MRAGRYLNPLVIGALLGLAPSTETVLARESVATLKGRVVGVADGDTLTLLDADRVQHRIRLDGVDSPERTQAYSQRAKQSLSDLTFQKDAVAACGKVDRYGRNVCMVAVEGQDVGLQQLELGLAWFFRRYANELSAERRAIYERAEAEARAARRGLWRDPSPVAPWDFRAAKCAEANE